MDFLYTNDLQERLDELYDMRSKDRTPGEWKEIEELTGLREAMGNYAWDANTQLIPEYEFVEYIKDFAVEVDNLDLPYYIARNIDWEGVAEDFKPDYNEVDFDGCAYFYLY